MKTELEKCMAGETFSADESTLSLSLRIPADIRSPIPVISVQSVGDLQYRWQS